MGKNNKGEIILTQEEKLEAMIRQLRAEVVRSAQHSHAGLFKEQVKQEFGNWSSEAALSYMLETFRMLPDALLPNETNITSENLPPESVIFGADILVYEDLNLNDVHSLAELEHAVTLQCQNKWYVLDSEKLNRTREYFRESDLLNRGEEEARKRARRNRIRLFIHGVIGCAAAFGITYLCLKYWWLMAIIIVIIIFVI